MKKNSMRFLSFLLAAIMVIAMFPAGVFAEDTANDVNIVDSGENDVQDAEKDPVEIPSKISEAELVDDGSIKADDLTFTVDEASLTATVTDGKSASGEVVIPAAITYDGKTYAVTAVAANAFNDANEVTKVTVPNSVTSLGGAAFANMDKLTEIVIGNGVTSWGSKLAVNNYELTTVVLAEGATLIGDLAFRTCPKLANVTLPSTLKTIGATAFTYSAITELTVPASVVSIGSDSFKDIDTLKKVTFLGADTKLGSTCFQMCDGLEEVILPANLTSIPQGAFRYCTALKTIDFPETLTEIGNYSFQGCTSLESVTISKNITNLVTNAFNGCTSLKNLTIEEGFNGTIGGYVFQGCTALESVVIPSSMETVGESMFNMCSSLKNVTLSEGVKTLNISAFANCTSLETLVLPDSLERMRHGSISNCTALKTLVVTGDNLPVIEHSNALTGLSDDLVVVYNGDDAFTGNWAALADNPKVSSDAVALIGTQSYETLKDAIAAANAIEGGATVTLLADVTLSEKLTISGNVTIEGAHTITRGIAGTIFAVDKNATLTLDGGVIIDGANDWTFDSENFYADMAAGKTLSTGAKDSYSTSAEGGLVATAQLITISGTKGALVMNNATIQNTWGSPLFAVPAGATLTMNDGSLIQHVRGQLINSLNGSWVMEGGKITDVHAHNTNGGLVDMRGSSTFTINDGEICYVTVLGLNANGNGIVAQVYGNTTKLTINGGNIHDNASFSPGGGWGSVVYLNRGGDFEMNGGTIEHTASDHCTAFVSNTSTSIVLNAGTIIIEESKAARFDSLIYGDTVIGENMKIEGDGLVVLLGDPGDTFENNGIIDSDMQICYGEVTGNGTYNGDVIIKVDDYFEFDGKVVISGGTWNGQLTVEDGASLSITGGTFANDPSEWLADGYKVTKLADGTYGVAEDPAYGKVAQVGNEYYETLKDAIAAANAIEGGATVTLLADVTLSEKLTISGNVTIEGAHTITRADAYTGTLFTVAADATLTLDGGLVIDGNNNWTLNEELYNKALALEVTGVTWDELITSEEGKPNATAPMFKVTGSLVANNVTIQNNYSNKSSNNGDYGVFQVDANATLTMTGATIKHIVTGGANSVAHLSTNSVWTINDGTLITDTFAAKNGGICRNDSGKLVMNGGEISNNKALNTNGIVVMLYKGSMEMNGGIICSNSGISGTANGRCAVIYGHSTSTFIMTDGEICHNTGTSYGGVDVPSSIKVEISGGYIGENISVNGNANADVNGNANTVITGGTFTQDVSAWLAPNTGLTYDETAGQYAVVTEGLYRLHLVDPNTGEPATVPYLEGNDLASLVATGKLFYADYYKMTLEVLYDVKIDKTVVIDYPMTIDLNGHTLTGVNVYPVIRVQGGAHVDVKNGTIINNDDYVFVLGASDGSTYGNLTIKSGKYVGGTTVASVTLGALTITGGEFEAKDTGYGHDYTLNCIDANYKNGAASIVVTGGTFYKFNPADNAAEGANTSFVNDKYLAEADGDYYTVRVNKNALPTIADIVITTENGETITLKYPGERFDSIQHMIGTNDYADFVLGADQNEMLAYVANGNVTKIVMNLYDDIALDAPLNFYNKYFQVPATYDITINGNNNTITWADGYNGTLINVESGVGVTLNKLNIFGDNTFSFYNDTTTIEDGQNWYTRFVDVGEEDKAINANVIVNAGDLTLNRVTIAGVTIASDGDNGKTANTETGGYYLMYNDDLAIIKSNGGTVALNDTRIDNNAGLILNAINAKTEINGTGITNNMGAGNKGGIIIANGGTMSIKDTSIDRNKAMARSATILGVINGAEVSFNGLSTMDNNKHIGVGSNTAGAMIVLEGASQFVMNGGSISNNIGGRAGAIASRWVGGNYGQHEDTSIVLNAGTIKGNTASNDSWNGASVFLRSPATIGEGMKIDGTIAVNAAPGALEITGGKFNNFDMIVTDGLTAEITGGTFDSDPTEWLAEGYVAPKNDDGTYSVRSQTYVEWIKAELLAGNSVKLDRDVVITDYDLVNALVLPSNGDGKYTEAHGNGAVFHVIKPGVVFDLNGYSLIWDAHDDDYCNKRQVSLFMVTITGNPGETADLTIIDSSAAKTGKVEVYGMGTGLYVVGVDAKGTISGGTWTNYPCNTCGASNIFIYPSHGGELYITDGTFEQKDSDYLIGWNGSSKPTTNNGVGIDQDATKVYITGGTFVGFNPETDVKFIDTANGSAVSEVNGCAEGYESTDNGDGTYGVIPTKLAKVEVEIMPGFWGTSYITVENWADLVAALGENTNVPVKVTLLENIKLTDEVLTIAGTTKKVIDLNGKRITGTFTEETTAFVYVTGGCELTILDSTVTEVDGFTAGGIHAIDTNGNLSNLIRVETDGKLVIESGSYSQDASVNGAGMIDSRGDEIITIKGGHFRLYNVGSAENGSPWIFNASSQNTKNIIVQGGTFNADIIHQYYPFEVMAPKELALVQGEDGIWHFVPAVAYVNEQEWSSNWYTNEVGYATLEDAIAAVEGIRTKNGKTSAEEFITLLADAVVTGDVDTKGITIEQNGFAIKLAAGATLTAPEGLNVTTDVANRKVVYENGVYKLTVITYAAQIGDTLYETIQDAVYAAQDGDIIIVLVDHEMNCADAVANTSGYAVLVNVANKAVTIDLNGKVITVNVDQNAEIYGIFATDTNGKLTLMDSSADKTGKVEITAPGYLYSVLFAYGADSKLTVNGGRYVADTVSDSLIYSQHNEIVEINDGYFYLGNVGTGSNGKPWIFNAKGQNTAHAIVKGGIFNADIIHQFYPFEVSAPKELALVKGVGGIWYFVPAVAYVNEQEWSSNWYTNEVGYATFEEAIAAVEGIRTKNGKTSAEEFITLLGDVMVTGNVDTKGITIVQGRFAIRLGIADATLTAVEGLNVTTDVANREVVYENGVYKLAVISYAAQIGDTLYETLQDAINAAEDGDEIIVLENINIADQAIQTLGGKYNTLFLVEDKSVIINLNGKTISGAYTGSSMLVGVFSTDKNGALTLTGNGTVDVTAETTVYGLIVAYSDGSSIVIENGTYKLDKASDNLIYYGGYTDAAVTVKGGTFELGNVGTGENGKPWIFNVLGAGDHHVFITGGTFNADINRQHWSNEAVVDKTCYVVKNGNGTWTVKAGAAAYVHTGMTTGPYYAPKDVGYATIEEAIAAAIAEKDDPITLLTDFVLTAPIDAAGKTIVQNGFAIKLATADATLTAAEGLNVTTDLEGYEVVYEEGTYKLIKNNRVTIGSVEDLLAFGNAVTGNTLYQGVKVAANPDVIVLLTADLNLTASGFAPMGNGSANAFSGTFDGQGHTISNMTLICDYYRGVGFFRSLGKGATIKDLTFVNADVNNGAATASNHFYGVVAGFSNNVTLDNVDIRDSKVTCKYAGSAMIGCLEGASTIKNCDIENVILNTTNIRGAVYGILGNSANGHTAALENNTFNNVVFIVDGEIKAVQETLKYNEWADGTEYTESMNVAQIGDTKYASLADAIAAANDGDTVTLIGDVVRASSLNVDKDVTIDFNGHTVYGSKFIQAAPVLRILADVTVKGGAVDGRDGSSCYAFIVGNGTTAGSLTIVDGKYYGDVSAVSVTKGTLTVLGGEFKVSESEYGATYLLNCIDPNYKDGSAKIVVKGGRFYGFNPENNAAEGAGTNFVPMGYRASIYGTIDGVDVYDVVELKATVEAGSITYYFPGVENVDNVQELANFYFLMQNAMGWIWGYDYEPVLTLYAELTDEVVLGNTPSDDTTVTLPGTVTWTIVTNGFNADLIKAAEGYAKVDNGDGTITIQKAVAKIGDTYFATLQEAIDKAEPGDTVVLLTDLSYTEADVVKTTNGNRSVFVRVEDKDIVLNMNDHKIYVEHLDGFTNDYIVAIVYIADGAGLTVTGNGTIDVKVKENDADVAYMFWKRGTTGHLTVENGTYHMNDSADSMVYTNGNEIVKIAGGTWTLDAYGTRGNREPWIFNVAGAGDNHVIVVGGTFNADINRQHWSNEVLVPETYYTVNNGNGTWTVKDGAVAYVATGMLTGPYFYRKNVGYATIEEAFAAAVAYKDGNITLLQNVTLTEDVEISIPGIVLNANGYALDCNGHEIKLTAIDATFTASEGLNVTTNMAGMKVVYEDGTYKLDKLVYVAEVNGTKYETLAEAILFAQPGDTIILLAEVSEDVTINKSITLDGAKFEYTGNITVTGETVDVIIKNVNFGNGTSYAVTTSHLNSITIEDCTVTGRAFLYSKLATQSIVVKNVTVTGGNYVANITYGSEAYFENVTAISMTGYGIYTQNYGAKTITLKNCSFDTPNYPSIAVRADRSAATDTFIFEGNNVMTSLRENEHTKYVLADVDATLTAPEGYTVTTTLADHKVVHEEGTYKVIPKDYVAEVNGVKYETLKDAFEACTNGETILLLKDLVYGDDDIVNAIGGATGFGQYPNPSIIYVGGTAGATPDENKPSNVNAVLDLNGHSITNNADAYLFLFMDNCKVTIKDSGNGDGIINNTELPAIWVVGTETLVTIESGKYSTESSSGVIHATHGGDLVITGGEFRTSASDATYLIVLNSHNNQNSKYFITGNATITVSGGTFYGFNPEQTLDAKTDKFVNVVAKRYIAQDNGDNSWTVVLGKVYNATTGNTFATIADAMLDAKLSTSDNDQIELLQNHEESVVLIYDGTTLNLKSFTLKADYLVSFTGGYITGDPCADKDSGARLIVPKQFVALAENAAVSGKGHALPIWDATANNNKGAFVFAQMAVSVKTNSGVTTDRNGNEILFVQFGINGTGFVKKNLLFEQAVSGFHVEIVASWNPLDDNGNVKSDTITQVYRFSDEAVTKVALGSSNFTGSVLLEGHENLTMYVRFVTDAGVVLSSAPLKAN